MWRPTSPLYRGTDTELTMKLTTFWFFCNRPTVGALIGLGSDLAAATAVAKPGDVPQPAEQPPAAEQSASQAPVCSATDRAAHALNILPNSVGCQDVQVLLLQGAIDRKGADHADHIDRGD